MKKKLLCIASALMLLTMPILAQLKNNVDEGNQVYHADSTPLFEESKIVSRASEPIYYVHPQLYIVFEINTSTKEATLGPRYDGNRDNCLEIPDILQYPNTNEWTEEIRRRTMIWQNMEIPSTITYKNEIYTVTSVAGYAFHKATEVCTIKLPETIRTIGSNAFSWCVNLTKINIPSKISEIAGSTFYLCQKLEQITLPSGVQKISNSAFRECWNLRKINIPGTCTKIENEAFSWCQSLSNIILEDGDQPLECGYSFELSINYQGSHTPQFRGIFADAPADTVYIGRGPFICPKTKNRQLRPFLSISNYANNASGGYTGYTGKNFDKVIFGDGVTIIQDSLFWASSIKEYVELPDNLREIGDYSFNASWGCFSQDSLVIPSSVTYIGDYAFQGCLINDLKLLGTCEEWGTSSFVNCKIQNLRIGPSVKTIKLSTGNNIIYVECLPLMPPSPNNLFSTIPIIVSPGSGSVYREQWKDATIIDKADGFVTINVKTPGSLYSRLLAQGYQLENVFRLKLKGHLDEVDLSTLKSMTKVYSYDLSELTMSELPQNFFQGMKKLFDISLPNNLTKVRDNEFRDCINLGEMLCIPSTCTSIGEYAFSNTNINALSCLGSVNIGSFAFSGCSNLSNVEFRDTTILNDFVFVSTNISGIYIPKGSVLMSNSFAESGLCSITFEDGVDLIEDKALGNDVSNITFNGAINNIGHQEFGNLKRINVADISTWCQLPFSDFEIMTQSPLLYIDNELVENIILPEDINIRDYAFYNCKTLISATLPSGISIIPTGIFKGCSKLSYVELPENVTKVGSEAFSDCSSLMTLDLPETIEILGDKSFLNCTKLYDIELPKSLKQIGNSAFENCSVLSEVDFPSSLSYIGESAYKLCTELNKIKIPTNILFIGELAFGGCNNLVEIMSQLQEPIQINENTFLEVNEKCVLYVPIMTASKYYAAGWILKNLKETGVLKVTVKGGGELVLDERTIRDNTEEFLFEPYKSFYLTLLSDEKYSVRKLKLNGEDAISIVEDGKIFIEEPEENIELYIVFGDDFVKDGDVNGDGLINKDDAILLMHYIVKDESKTIFDYASDMNSDDIINVIDVLLIISETNK